MKTRKYCFISLLAILTAACSGGSGTPVSSSSLSGIWKAEETGLLLAIHQRGETLSVDLCNGLPPLSMTENDHIVSLDGSDYFRVLNLDELEYAGGPYMGTTVTRVSHSSRFNSGSVSVTSSNIDDLSTDQNVCAFVFTGSSNFVLVAPYLDDDLSIELSNLPGSAGQYLIPDDTNLSLTSPELPGNFIDAETGTIDITKLTDEGELELNFTFTASDGNEYSGTLDITL